ncbi:Sulfite reduction-associated complex DsrMKJOP protein DsrP (= HmeB) [hydrothermal vent metagenome]|uniref:Sulfite reduction-associated complex DsrMKJOP protein DsrP (= HmeB) n=1 Tax=hydrothermal vent metagenome TaxID=652676 RepID=A0A3B0Z5J6_9ZZZZ
MRKVKYLEIEGKSMGFRMVALILAGLTGIGLLAAYYLEHSGHHASGMNNQIVWGLPHVFAIFLIVAASGALNVASIGTVFGKTIYQPLARLSALLAIMLLLGGLLVLILDLGNMFHVLYMVLSFNPTSMFAWNIPLYSGFFGLVAFYLWTMMDQSMNGYYKKAGYAAFIWRLILTTGTGSIFAFLVARPGYDAAIMGPMFVIMSFSFGLAIFMLLVMGLYKGTGRPLGNAILYRLKNLLGVFIAAVLYFVIVFHLTNLYSAEHQAVERFILFGSSIHTSLFWIGYVVIGSIIPLIILYTPLGKSFLWIASACGLVVIGGFAQIYTIVIGGQAKALEIFNPSEWTVVKSGFYDLPANGVYHAYTPTLPELLLGVFGVTLAILGTLYACKILRFAPESLADKDVDPHQKSA